MKNVPESKMSSTEIGNGGSSPKSLLWAGLLLLVALCLLYYKSFAPHQVVFSNDGPYGSLVAEQTATATPATGLWVNLNWIGSEYLSPAPTITTFLRAATSANFYARFLPLASLLIVGLGATFCFYRLGLKPLACILGGLAAGLNSDFLSTSSWGVASQTVGFGAMYVALGLLSGNSSKGHWARVALAGLAVGIGVMEAYDIGALFSVFVAAYVLYEALFTGEGAVGKKFGLGVGRIALVAVAAGLISAPALTGLVGTQVVGMSGAQQDSETKEKTWPFKTQWSLPKAEVLQVLVPGIFGYRNHWHMYDDDQPKEDQYWGLIGADPNIDMARSQLSNPDQNAREQASNYLKNPNVLWRLVGTGFYAGVPVVVIALWAVLQAFRKRGSPFTNAQRTAIKFWGATLVLTLLLSFGRHAPFYHLFYALPYASTIRNPDKFMHIFTWALIIIFAYGLHGLVVAYMQKPVTRINGLWAQFKKWRATATPFENKWITGCVLAIGASLLAWLIYASNSSNLISYLQTVAISAEDAPGVVAFSIHSVGWFILFLTLTVGLLALIFSGQFTGPRARWAGVLLGAVLVIDLARAGSPWIIYWDTDYKYAVDPVMQFLADKPYEHRVAMLPIPAQSQQLALLQSAYGSSWKQHLFVYKNIQCPDVIQEPRVSQEKEEFMQGLPPNSLFNVLRFWQLSNTRYILGPGGDFVSKQLDPTGTQFRVVKTFNFEPRRANPMSLVDYLATPKPDGELAVIEFMNALPRAKLFTKWEVNTDNQKTIQTLASQTFDPLQRVLVANPGLPAATATNAAQNPGTVEVNTNYASRRIELAANVTTPSVLMLSERYSPKWHVTVDGKPAELLRCDSIMRGVFLSPGKHDIVFQFVPERGMLYVSLASMAAGLILCGWLAVTHRGEKRAETPPSPNSPVKRDVKEAK